MKKGDPGGKGGMKQWLHPQTIQDLEQCCTELFAVYWHAMEAAKPIERQGRQLEARLYAETMRWLRAQLVGREYKRSIPEDEHRALLQEYKRNRARFRSKANLYRRQAETILKVLEWAAPDKHRAISEALTKEAVAQQRALCDLSATSR